LREQPSKLVGAFVTADRGIGAFVTADRGIGAFVTADWGSWPQSNRCRPDTGRGEPARSR
jgi:hypothetical protein